MFKTTVNMKSRAMWFQDGKEGVSTNSGKTVLGHRGKMSISSEVTEQLSSKVIFKETDSALTRGQRRNHSRSQSPKRKSKKLNVKRKNDTNRKWLFYPKLLSVTLINFRDLSVSSKRSL